MQPRPTSAFALYGIGFAAGIIFTLAVAACGDYQRWAYHYFNADYRKVGWVYDQMIVGPRKVDSLFMGSSHTLDGIDDGLIAQKAGSASAAYNAAIPTSGRNLEYVVLRDILERKAPRRLFLEVRETEERTGHFGFPIVARIGDIAAAPSNPWWLKDALESLQYRFQYLMYFLPMLRRTQEMTGASPQFGFIPSPTQQAMPLLLASAHETKASKRWHILPRVFGDAEFRASEKYIRQIAELCQQRHVELHFLYLPFLGGPAEPMQADFYRRYGTLHGMPSTIRNDPQLWSNVTHLNRKGAQAYTSWLIADVLGR